MTMTNKISSSPPIDAQWSLLWPAVLLVTALAGTTLISGAMLLVAVATLAAATMTRRAAIITLLLFWGVNQVLGFTIRGYPHNLLTVGWGTANGLGGVLALIVTQMILKPGKVGFRLVPTFGLAFIAYELTLFGFSRVTGWACPFTVDVIVAVATNEALGFAGLWLAYFALGLIRHRPMGLIRQRAR
jgi:hypothetical protein